MRAPGKTALMALIAALVFLGDALTKYLVVARLTFLFTAVHAVTLSERVHAFVAEKSLLERGLATRPFIVFEPFLQFLYTQNPGAAFSFRAGAGERIRVPFFHLVTVAAVVFITLYARKLRQDQRLLQVSLSLLLGGALGNGLDRVLRGYVIDFIAVHWFDPGWTSAARHFPTFNIADCGVTIGISLLLLDSFLHRKEGQGPAVPAR
jgi:signal peptidase II